MIKCAKCPNPLMKRFSVRKHGRPYHPICLKTCEIENCQQILSTCPEFACENLVHSFCRQHYEEKEKKEKKEKEECLYPLFCQSCLLKHKAAAELLLEQTSKDLDNIKISIAKQKSKDECTCEEFLHVRNLGITCGLCDKYNPQILLNLLAEQVRIQEKYRRLLAPAAVLQDEEEFPEEGEETQKDAMFTPINPDFSSSSSTSSRVKPPENEDTQK